ncbi:AlpA family transcriptional regulator [Glaciecola sp. KUL10]|uniref:helix-turn-helix transcriptional regulator n=1 Tax=Glaciecola sp. (strain KUL10) TaxID=2161813 RepID=UPI000D787288|nr:AlpA family phage regulatory protein [Glaciecola sp. KUL10]GBL03160.1 phage transcriptional regulator [Glaciecola sp. KUL10]
MSATNSIVNYEKGAMKIIRNKQTYSARLLKLEEVLNLLSISKAYHFALLNEESKSFDPAYPKQISIGIRAVRYSEKELLEWIEIKKSGGRA